VRRNCFVSHAGLPAEDANGAVACHTVFLCGGSARQIQK